jgi:predicted GNAT superfamily acetyltransferase
VRPLDCEAEYEAAVALQEDIWGADVNGIVPACLLQVSAEVGGIADGAFTPDEKLVGFVFGLTGPRNGELAHWSHVLAVAEAWRGLGIGRLLKAHQRERLLAIGVDSMFWTFDPLESRNAHLNLNKLGARVEAYIPDFYGTNALAKTDTVIGTDRLVVRWDLKKFPAPSASCGLALTDIPLVTVRPRTRESMSALEVPEIMGRYVRVEAPSEIQELKGSDPEAAVAWRTTTRRAFVRYLDAGYRVVEFRPASEGDHGCYVLEACFRTDAGK